MTDKSDIQKIVHDSYWTDDVNCATTMLRVLSAAFRSLILNTFAKNSL